MRKLDIMLLLLYVTVMNENLNIEKSGLVVLFYYKVPISILSSLL